MRAVLLCTVRGYFPIGFYHSVVRQQMGFQPHFLGGSSLADSSYGGPGSTQLTTASSTTCALQTPKSYALRLSR